MLCTKLPATLKSLFLFEDFNKVFHPNRFQRRADPAIGWALAHSGCNLQKLSASFLADAKDFFPSIWPKRRSWREALQTAPHYPALEHLALTSQFLQPDRHIRAAQTMLVAAGVAAFYHMPKLKIMEIWGVGEGHRCLFRFRAGAKGCEILWKSTWDGDMAAVFKAWRWMARNVRPRRKLSIKIWRVAWRDSQSYSDFLHTLALRRDVIDPVSGFQVKWENQLERETT